MAIAALVSNLRKRNLQAGGQGCRQQHPAGLDGKSGLSNGGRRRFASVIMNLGHPLQREIPIEPAEPPRTISRDFLPWRFSDAERGPAPHQSRANGVRDLHIKSPCRFNASEADPPCFLPLRINYHRYGGMLSITPTEFEAKCLADFIQPEADEAGVIGEDQLRDAADSLHDKDLALSLARSVARKCTQLLRLALALKGSFPALLPFDSRSCLVPFACIVDDPHD